MISSKKTTLDIIFNSLFQPYMERVPDASKISEEMIKQGLIRSQDDVVNDHVAFRTLGVPNLGIASFEKIFLHYGYQKMDHYRFEKKRLDAYWYEPTDERHPRIFISELRVSDLSKNTQQIIHKYTNAIKSDPVDAIDLNNSEQVKKFFYDPLWSLPTIEEYELLMEESEYAAWVIYNRYYLNHYTISVHDLPGDYCQLENFNQFLESIGIKLNTAGGKIKTSADGLLKQTSTVAEMIEGVFAEGKKKLIPGSYVEFAERLPLDVYSELPREELTRTHRRNGFESGNADKIFESTYTTQTKSREKKS